MLNILKRIGLCLCPFLLTVLLCVLKERYIKITLLVIIVFIITYIGSKVLEFIKSKLTFKQSNKISVIIGGTVCQIYWFICFIILYANFGISIEAQFVLEMFISMYIVEFCYCILDCYGLIK